MTAQANADAETENVQSGTYSERADQYASGNVLIDMDPVGTRSVADGDTIEIVAIAVPGADVTATVNGQMITLEETSQNSGVYGCSKYVGEYRVSNLTGFLQYGKYYRNRIQEWRDQFSDRCKNPVSGRKFLEQFFHAIPRVPPAAPPIMVLTEAVMLQS